MDSNVSMPSFDEHVPVKQRVDQRINSGKRLPGAISKTADVATAGARAGAEEVLEILASRSGRDFIHMMALEVINGYLKCATSDDFRHAGKVAASDVVETITSIVSENSRVLYRGIAAHSPVSVGLAQQYAGPYLMVLGAAVLAALLRFVFFGLGPIW